MARTLWYDAPYWFQGFGQLPARTYLRVYGPQPGRLPVVIVTELAHNPGTSITNAAELLAQQVWDDENVWSESYERSREGFIWIEHYPGTPLPPDEEPGPGDHENFSEVTFEIGADGKLDIRDALYPGETRENPWRFLRREVVEELIGQSFPVVPDERRLGDFD